MKRFIFILFISLLFCGCSFFSSLFGSKDEEVEKTVKVNSNGDVYLVKLNMSNKTIKGDNTGYVTDVSRSAADSREYYDTDSFVRDLNKQINDGVGTLFSDSSRSVGIQSSVASGYSTTSFGATETFWSYVDTKTQTTILGGTQEVNVPGEVTAEKKYTGTYCYIYADTRNDSGADKGISLSDDDYKALGQKFDACYALETSIIGNPLYSKYNDSLFVPCNQKIVILVSDLFGDAKKDQQSGTVGYFYSGDLYSQTFFDDPTTGLNKGLDNTDPSYIHSNECEMFYIDALFLTKMPDTVYSTLVHEFNHMINYVVKTVNYMTNKTNVNALRSCDTWFTEMLAMTTEDMFQSYLKLKDEDSPKARLPYFGFAYYYGFKSWDDKKVEPLIMYANTYAFGAFLARNFGGVELIKQIAQNDYVNEQAITKALQTIYPNETYTDEKTQETKPIDYTYALRKFTMCIVNTGADNSFSLNRGTGFKNGLGFTPINLVMDITYDGSNYTLPLTFKKDAKLDLYPSGFSVHYIGTNIKSFKLNASTNEELEYYLIQ
ncbi:MAG: hypothetical protein J5687_07350 [Treponema sp.]|nr:hypothetical protein [Treponema sp.]